MTRISSFEEYATLVDSSDSESQDRLRNEVIPEELWVQIMTMRPDLIRAISLSKKLPDAVIRILASNVDPNVRCDIAMKRSLPADLFLKLSEDIDESVRTRVACNNKTPRAILKKLMHDECLIVSEAARKQLDREARKTE